MRTKYGVALSLSGIPFLIGTIIAVFFSTAESAERIIHSKDSLYHHIVVSENGPFRALRFGLRAQTTRQSMVNTKDLNRHCLKYTPLTFSGLLFNSRPRNVLIIGLGGGVIPREMHRYFPDTLIDVVEIDPEVLRIAEEYFFFQPDDKLRVHTSDGRVFVRRQAEKQQGPGYDYIILDAFNSEYIPFHLTTLEFLWEVNTVLRDKGVVVANVFPNNQLFDAEYQTFHEAYGRCYVFFTEGANNAMIVAPKAYPGDLQLDDAIEKAALLQKRHSFSFNLVAVARQLEPRFRPTPGAMVLTDTSAPVNILRQRSREIESGD